jgi:hypothetical protein
MNRITSNKQGNILGSGHKNQDINQSRLKSFSTSSKRGSLKLIPKNKREENIRNTLMVSDGGEELKHITNKSSVKYSTDDNEDKIDLKINESDFTNLKPRVIGENKNGNDSIESEKSEYRCQ